VKYLIIITAMFLVGCQRDNYWKVDYVPTTDAERQAIVKHVEKIITPPPSSLSGDPDWQESIESAYQEARVIFCKPTLWEYDGNSFAKTGRWKYLDEAAPLTKKKEE
jgi:hypothetical protein